MKAVRVMKISIAGVLLLIAGVYSYTKNNCICGIQNREIANYSSPKFAWIVALLTENLEAFCSGALISDIHVLTAGSCIVTE